jgi:hypothetical protein
MVKFHFKIVVVAKFEVAAVVAAAVAVVSPGYQHRQVRNQTRMAAVVDAAPVAVAVAGEPMLSCMNCFPLDAVDMVARHPGASSLKGSKM